MAKAGTRAEARAKARAKAKAMAKIMAKERLGDCAMKICLIGCGNLAKNIYGPSLLKYREYNGGCDFSACCDADGRKAQALAERFGFRRSYADMREMLGAERPDAVFAVVSERAMASVATETLSMGFPLMMEKPPGIGASEARAIQRAAHENNVMNQVAFNRRHMPLVREFRRLLRQQGEPVFIRYDMVRVGRCDEQFAWTAIHAVDAARFIAGCDYSAVKMEYMAMPQGGMFQAGIASIKSNAKNYLLTCRFENGSAAQISVVPQGGLISERIEAHAKTGSIFARLPVWDGYDAPGGLEFVSGGKQALAIAGERLEVFEASGFYGEIEAFLECVRHGVAPADSIDTAIQTMEVAECLANGADYIGWES
jgi:predicted dehydrogenase